MHSYCITLFVSRNGFIGVDKVLPLKTIDIDIMIPIISLPCRYLITYVDSVFLSCSITDSTVHLLEDLFTSTINRGRKRETTGFCCKLPHLQMRSLLEREREREVLIVLLIRYALFCFCVLPRGIERGIRFVSIIRQPGYNRL